MPISKYDTSLNSLLSDHHRPLPLLTRKEQKVLGPVSLNVGPNVRVALDVLDLCERLYICESDQPQIYNAVIKDETGKRLFYINSYYEMKECFCKCCESGNPNEPASLERGIIISDWSGHRLVIAHCTSQGAMSYHHCLEFDITVAGNHIGKLYRSCFARNAYHAVSNDDNHNFLIESSGCCLRLCCCPCTITELKIKDMLDGGKVIGEMQINRKENIKGELGVSFPASMKVQEKAVLLVSAVVLNGLYFNLEKYCGRTGRLGAACTTSWIICSVVALVVLIVILLVVYV